MRNKCRTTSELGSPPPPHTPSPFFCCLPCFIDSVQLRLILRLSHYSYDADYSLLDCYGLVVRLPLSLSVVRRLELSGQAKYFFIPFKGTSKTKQTRTTSIKLKERKKDRKKEENDYVELNPNLRQRSNRQAILILVTLLRLSGTRCRPTWELLPPCNVSKLS